MSIITKKNNISKFIDRIPPLRWTKYLLVKIGLTGRVLVIAVPMIWLLVFLLIPFLVIGKISLSEALIARPPYSSLLEWGSDGLLLISLNFGNYYYLIDDALYISAYLNSLKIAFISTIFCLLIGYPIAYYIAKSSENKRNILLMLIILPFWTSFLLRVYSWIGFFKSKGIINEALLSLDIISEPLIMMQTDFAVYVGIVYTYLPFMILPLYSNLVKLDDSLLEASADLGGKPMISFFKITLPLSIPGIIAGSMLVLIPAVGEFVIPALLGGPDTLMIGRVLWDEFFSNRDWPVAAAVSIVMLVVLILPVMWIQNKQNSNTGES